MPAYLSRMTQPAPVSHSPAPVPHPDVVVAGAGVVGLALALALAQAGLSVVSLGPLPLARNGRTVALLDGSVRMLAALGVWPRLKGLTAPLATMRLVDDTPSLFRTAPLDFRASEIGLPAFGHNVENADLVAALAAEGECLPNLVHRDALLESCRAGPDRVAVSTSEGEAIEAPLLVAADGAQSAARAAAGIRARQETYPQVALTALLHHEAPHGNVSTEFHTRQGPFTLVPLPGTAEAPNRSSLVWVMAPGEAERRHGLDRMALDGEIERRSQFMLGRVAAQGAIGRFPIRRLVATRFTADRVVLAGEAAHALPPIGAQGLNLSLRDAATLVDILGEARTAGVDLGSPRVLERYERARAGDVALRSFGVGALNRALLSSWLPVDAVRGLGMVALARLAPMRRALMRGGLMPRHGVPRLMRGDPMRASSG